jgi:OmpA-OmpF porin, OOP family
MKRSTTRCPRGLLPLALAAALATAATMSVAQTGPGSDGRSSATSSSRGEGWSVLPWTRRGYVGLNVGRSDYGDLACGVGFSCDDSGTRGHVYTGGYFNDWLGMEVGYMNEGKVDRSGGSTRAEGINLSLVGRVPLGSSFNAFGKVGSTYGRTRVSASPLSGITEGRERGWGPSFGIGAGFDFTNGSGIVLEWSRNDYHVPGGGRSNIDGASLGYVHRF